MNSRRTPPHKGRPNYLNATTSSGNKSWSKSPFNETFNATIASTTIRGSSVRTRLLGTTVAPQLDEELEYDLVYNKYLNSLVKQHLLQEEIARQESVLEEQLEVKKAVLVEMQEKECFIQRNIKNLAKQERVLELLCYLEEELKEVVQMNDQFHVFETLERLYFLLEQRRKTVFLKNVKPFKSQEEYDKFVVVLRKCWESLERMFQKEYRDFEGVEKLGEAIEKYLKFLQNVQEIEMSLTKNSKDAVYDIMENLSNSLAKLRGYD